MVINRIWNLMFLRFLCICKKKECKLAAVLRLTLALGYG